MNSKDNNENIRIAPEFDFMLELIELKKKTGVNFVIGGSAELFLRHIDVRFNDVDVIAATPNDAEIIRQNFFKNQEVSFSKSAKFDSSFFEKFQYGSGVYTVDVDLFSNYKIKNSGKWYEYLPDFSTNTEIAGWPEGLPVAAVEDWYVIYHLIGDRPEKVSILEKWFALHPPIVNRFDKWLNQGLPEQIEDCLKRY